MNQKEDMTFMPSFANFRLFRFDCLDAFQQTLFRFLAHAWQGAQFAGLGGRFELCQGSDIGLFPEQGSLFGTQAGHLQ
jgi:hypothetical protein